MLAREVEQILVGLCELLRQHAAHPTFSTPTSYVTDIDVMLEALKKAAR